VILRADRNTDDIILVQRRDVRGLYYGHLLHGGHLSWRGLLFLASKDEEPTKKPTDDCNSHETSHHILPYSHHILPY
jgi:hypothetical protein